MSADPMPESGVAPLRRSHNHLDHARREPGECPACDDDWQQQADRLAGLRAGGSDHGQIDRLIAFRNDQASRTICVAISIDGVNHTCDLRPGHRGHHHCPRCRTSWSSLP